MNDITTQPNITLREGQPVTTSLDVAERFGKRHDHVLRDIRRILETAPKEFSLPNFGEWTYLNDRKQPQPMYHITKNGFALLAMGFTGQEAMTWKIAYITAFDAMEQELRRIQQEAADRHFQMLNDVLTGLFDNHPNWDTIRTLMGNGQPVRITLAAIGRKSADTLYRAARQMAAYGLMEKRPVFGSKKQYWGVPDGQPLKFQLVQ